MKNIKYILILVAFTGSLWSNSSTVFEEFDRINKKTASMFKVVNSGVKRNVYDILSEYKNPKAELITKWFSVASQVTDNDDIGFFIKRTKYKVGALVEQLLFDSTKALSERDREVLRNKFKFLKSYSKKNFVLLNQKCYTTKEIYLRTMPIVVPLTKKKSSIKNFMILRKKTPLVLLYKITYNQDGKRVNWGYVESIIDDRIGWVNLKLVSTSK